MPSTRPKTEEPARVKRWGTANECGAGHSGDVARGTRAPSGGTRATLPRALGRLAGGTRATLPGKGNVARGTRAPWPWHSGDVAVATLPGTWRPAVTPPNIR